MHVHISPEGCFERDLDKSELCDARLKWRIVRTSRSACSVVSIFSNISTPQHTWMPIFEHTHTCCWGSGLTLTPSIDFQSRPPLRIPPSLTGELSTGNGPWCSWMPLSSPEIEKQTFSKRNIQMRILRTLPSLLTTTYYSYWMEFLLQSWRLREFSSLSSRPQKAAPLLHNKYCRLKILHSIIQYRYRYILHIYTQKYARTRAAS